MMKHFLNLERCTCGAYRYLAVREHKRSFEVYLIHHSHVQTGSDLRKYSKLASVPKYLLNIHDPRSVKPFEEKNIKLSYEQSLLLRSLLGQVTRAVSQEENEQDDPLVEIEGNADALEISQTAV